jgi:hypothetical protein
MILLLVFMPKGIVPYVEAFVRRWRGAPPVSRPVPAGLPAEGETR